MLTKALDWIIGREPVATATGLAGGIAALYAVLEAFDVLTLTPKQVAAVGALAAWFAGWLARRAVAPITTPAERKVNRLMAIQPGDPLEEDTGMDDGSLPLALLILVALAVLLLLGLGVCTDALFHDEDEPNDLGQQKIVLISHERARCYDYDDCDDDGQGDYGGGYGSNYGGNRRDDRGRDRGAFSPGPFDDSPVDAFNNNTICLPGSYCTPDDRRDDEEQPE